ncbi:MAG: hypothetical protein RLY31_1982 [Bacteroidota bacterium]|jgi:hypothetical protein
MMLSLNSLERFGLAWLLVPALLMTGCVIRGNGYSFKGISIPPEVDTYYVALFDNQAPSALPTLPRDFTERMKDKIRQETRLQYDDVDPDIEFSGIITDYRVTAEAPKAGEQIGFNKLTIVMQVSFTNNRNEKADWKQQFSFEDFFGATDNLLDVQDALVENISKELAERIFNKAFTNW